MRHSIHAGGLVNNRLAFLKGAAHLDWRVSSKRRKAEQPHEPVALGGTADRYIGMAGAEQKSFVALLRPSFALLHSDARTLAPLIKWNTAFPSEKMVHVRENNCLIAHMLFKQPLLVVKMLFIP